MRKLFMSAVVLFSNSQSMALDLQEALASAYNNNDELKTNRREFLIAIEQFPKALSEFLPSINASIDSTKSRSKNKSQYGSGNPSSETKILEKGIVLDQPIFNGGSGVAGLKAAQAGFRAARAQYYANEQKILSNAIDTYLDCYEAKEKYDISETSVRANEKQLESEQEKLNVGESTQTEVASAKFALSQAETRRLTFYANLQTAKATFLKVFGVEPLDISLPELPNDLPKSFEELQEKSLAANQNIEIAKHTITASKADEVVAKSNLLPNVSFKLQGGRTYYDPESSNNSGFQNSSGVSSVIAVRVPIFPKGGVVYSEIRKAKIASRINAIKLDLKIKEVIASCRSSWEGFYAAKSSIVSTSQGVEAAQKAYEGIVQEELVGSKTILDVLVIEDKLSNAKFTKVEANKQCLQSAFQMKSLLGKLTAKSLKLNVNYFIPENEFKKTKMKIIGF